MSGVSEWSLTASCASCGAAFSVGSTAVLLHDSLFGPRGTVLDVLGERWPEPGLLFHPRCFAARSGRRALWTSFLRGRFDKGVPPAKRRGRRRRNAVAESDDAPWSLRAHCCDCSSLVAPAGPAVVHADHGLHRWRWLPVFQDCRPGQLGVYHLRCFVSSHGRAAAYALLGVDLWTRLPASIKRVGGVISPLP